MTTITATAAAIIIIAIAIAAAVIVNGNTTPNTNDDVEVLIADETPAADFDAVNYLLDVMEATAATINPDNVDLFVYRPALDGATKWTATLHNTCTNVVTTVTGGTETPQFVNVTTSNRVTGESAHVEAANPLQVAREIAADLASIAA